MYYGKIKYPNLSKVNIISESSLDLMKLDMSIERNGGFGLKENTWERIVRIGRNWRKENDLPCSDGRAYELGVNIEAGKSHWSSQKS